MSAEAWVESASGAYLESAMKVTWPGAAESIGPTEVISASALGGSSLAPSFSASSLSLMMNQPLNHFLTLYLSRRVPQWLSRYSIQSCRRSLPPSNPKPGLLGTPKGLLHPVGGIRR